MKKNALSRALWACVDAEIVLQEMLRALTNLHAQLPDTYHRQVVDLLDELNAATHHVQAAKYNALISIRNENK